ncbi:RelA/SpoT [Penicillium longicatenatum]|nr:RelA/SpoT [Penicillium longicatenatum]
MDVSVARQPEPPAAAANDNIAFTTANEVGQFFDELLRTSGQRLDNSKGATAETLKCFLESMNQSNRASLRELFAESGLSISPDLRYTEFKRQYAPLVVNQMLYIIDKEYLVKNNWDVINPYAPPPAARKIEIMMSTILWADQLYSSCGGTEWKMGFITFPCDSLMNYLKWLGKVKQRRFLEGDQLSDQDENILFILWRWFETHGHRPIRLAFAMASRGMVRNIRQEIGNLRLIIESLDELDNYPMPIGNRAYTVT